MAYIPGVQQTGKTTIDFNCPERSGYFDRVGFTHLAFPQPDGTVRVDIIGGYSRLENATLGILNHMMTHLDHSMLDDDKAADLGRLAFVAARSALAACKSEEEGQVTPRRGGLRLGS